jgi:hypothetical protein
MKRMMVRNIRVTMRKSISPEMLSISSNSVSIVVKRTMGVSAVGAVDADASSSAGVNAGAGLDLNAGVDVDIMMRERRAL